MCVCVCVSGGGVWRVTKGAVQQPAPFAATQQEQDQHASHARGTQHTEPEGGERHTVHAWSCTGVMKESRPFATFTATSQYESKSTQQRRVGNGPLQIHGATRESNRAHAGP